jgi:hypothetical protein
LLAYSIRLSATKLKSKAISRTDISTRQYYLHEERNILPAGVTILGCLLHSHKCMAQVAGWAKQIWRARLRLFCSSSFSLFPVSDSKKAGSDPIAMETVHLF